MARTFNVLLAMTLTLAPLQALAADGEVRTCDLHKIIECVPDGGCGEWSPRDLSLPRFVRIDLQGKTITSLDKDVDRSSKIATVERLNGMTILHGTELRGWSATITDETGDLTLSAAGPEEGFIAFGSCITR